MYYPGMNGSMLRRLVTSALLVFLGTSCGSATATDTSVNAPPDGSMDTQQDIVEDAPMDEVADSPSEAATKDCVKRSGTCVEGYPAAGGVQGFTVTCPPGSTLANGQSSMTNGGLNIIDSSLAFGCSRNPNGTTSPALCCFPADAGIVDSTTSD
jgi:hypothetical protein